MSASRKNYGLFGVAIGVFAGGVLGISIPATLADSGGKGTVASDLENHEQRIKDLAAAVKSLQVVVEAQKRALATQSLSFQTASFGSSQLNTAEGGSIELGSGAAGSGPYIDFKGHKPGDYNVRLMNERDGRLDVYGDLHVRGLILGQTIISIDDRLKVLESDAVRYGKGIGLSNPSSTLCMDLRAQSMGNWQALQGTTCKGLEVGNQTWTIQKRH